MIDGRLFQLTEKKNLFLLVAARLLSLILSIALWWNIANSLNQYLNQQVVWLPTLLVLVVVLILKNIIARWQDRLTYQASADLRVTIRHQIMAKAFRLGKNQQQLPQATLAQLSVDGIEQLEIYYARFLPQLFYCLLAAGLIFITLVQFAFVPALVLLLCMPLIPIVIMSVMKIAKKILSKYWTRYTDLGASFHENLSGLTTLKAYHQDGIKQQVASQAAEKFRRVTMSLLSMQLNSITIMDVVSYGGAALGIGLALISYQQEKISTLGVLMFILLSAEFFIPMRQLGSLFHVAMNGISACKKLFDYLELPELAYGPETLAELHQLSLEQVTFAYEDAPALKNISMTFKKGEFTALVGPSGSGKSTLVKLLLHQFDQYQGAIFWNQKELKTISKATVTKLTTLVDSKGYLYPDSIRENLLLANPEAKEAELWQVLKQVQLADFVADLPASLEEKLTENGSNLSGGQRQRLLLARELLKKAEVYVFDEITSGVDLQSEEIILDCLQKLATEKMVIFISHRLYNVLAADQVYVFEQGGIIQQGAPETLQQQAGYFKNYFTEEAKILKTSESR